LIGLSASMMGFRVKDKKCIILSLIRGRNESNAFPNNGEEGK